MTIHDLIEEFQRKFHESKLREQHHLEEKARCEAELARLMLDVSKEQAAKLDLPARGYRS